MTEHAPKTAALLIATMVAGIGCGAASFSTDVDAGNQPSPAADASSHPDAQNLARTDAGGSGGPDAGGAGGTVTLPAAGNPSGSCSLSLPAEAQPVDTSNPTTVIGSGAPDGCTYQALASAVAQGGIITFNCGPSQVVIPITATIELPTDRTTVIDGGNKIVLDGQSSVRILHFYSDNYQVNDNGITLQHIALINGKAIPTEAIPVRPEPCSQGWNDGEGGAL